MFITHATKEQINKALDLTNEKEYDGNIRFYSDYNRGEPEPYRNGFRVRLKVHTVEKKGHRWHPDLRKLYGPNPPHDAYEKGAGKRSAFACWHVYGHFFEHLFEIAPDAAIRSRDKKITVEEGNWEDWNVGSQRFRFYASDACFCSVFDEIKKVETTPVEQLINLIHFLNYMRSILVAIKRLPKEDVPLLLGNSLDNEQVKTAIEKRLRKG